MIATPARPPNQQAAHGMWNPWKFFGPQRKDEFLRRRSELLATAPIPCLWLLGKTGSGKTSIVRYLTGAADAEIGRGYRPQTRYSRLFSFPDADVPIVQFLDTRGLGEAGYDPAEDLAQFDSRTHLVIATVRATDQATDEVVGPLKQIRKANPERPVLLAVSCLHDAYPGQQHPNPDPFDSSERPMPANIPEDLRRCIGAQYDRFDGLFDRAVAIDLTPPSDGFVEQDFGGPRLKAAVLELLPKAYRQTLLQMDQLREALLEIQQERSLPIILAHSVLAASAAAVPIPWIDLPVVMAIQSHLAHRLALVNQQHLDAAALAHVTVAMGGRLAIRMGLRELLKFIPWLGMAANAAAAFAFMYASGWVWNWYFLEIRKGHVPDASELRQVYQEQLRKGVALWKTTMAETHA
ncbi:MAG TPA: GTPase domain-containing protein [Planctomycetaceae bacterium]|nr:GTPase domain-containing protein [Planctomycetaceae bacterium]